MGAIIVFILMAIAFSWVCAFIYTITERRK